MREERRKEGEKKKSFNGSEENKKEREGEKKESLGVKREGEKRESVTCRVVGRIDVCGAWADTA